MQIIKRKRSIPRGVCLIALATLGMAAPSTQPSVPLPPIPAPVLFNTPAADAILRATQVFPPDNPWHANITSRPVLPNSDRIIAKIGKDKRLAVNLDMAFIIVPPTQAKVDVRLTDYPAESDRGPYPVPPNAPIEGWPLSGGDLATLQVNGDGDRHLIVLDPVNKTLYEFWRAFKSPTGWRASCEATFDLTSNATRPPGWTSSDAAGLPLFPAIVRYDELERGEVRHALRFTVRQTRRAYLYPATHFASRSTDPDLPAMGERFRLKPTADLNGLPPHAATIARALQTYGMIVADNGGDWRISIAPDPRIQDLSPRRKFKGSDFEVTEPPPKP